MKPPDFFRFPHTPHLFWLGATPPRADKVLTDEEAADFLSGDVVVEEKVDGANTGLSVGSDGVLRVQNRGEYLGRGAHPQFQPLWPWLEARRVALTEALAPNLMLFGEWCFAVHSLRYEALPDWFLAFDVFDRREQRFWSTARRDGLLEQLGISKVPAVARGRFGKRELLRLLSGSRVGIGPAEGLYVRCENAEWLVARAKIVRAEFVQAIEEHWSARPLERNRLS
jgi:hypothetical protein